MSLMRPILSGLGTKDWLLRIGLPLPSGARDVLSKTWTVCRDGLEPGPVIAVLMDCA